MHLLAVVAVLADLVEMVDHLLPVLVETELHLLSLERQ
jgi:hypothetical protein